MKEEAKLREPNHIIDSVMDGLDPLVIAFDKECTESQEAEELDEDMGCSIL